MLGSFSPITITPTGFPHHADGLSTSCLRGRRVHLLLYKADFPRITVKLMAGFCHSVQPNVCLPKAAALIFLSTWLRRSHFFFTKCFKKRPLLQTQKQGSQRLALALQALERERETTGFGEIDALGRVTTQSASGVTCCEHHGLSFVAFAGCYPRYSQSMSIPVNTARPPHCADWLKLAILNHC